MFPNTFPQICLPYCRCFGWRIIDINEWKIKINNLFLKHEINIIVILHSGGSRIFPRGVRQLPKMLLFLNFFAENCMKMKEFGPPWGARPWRPLGSANASYIFICLNCMNPEINFWIWKFKHCKIYHSKGHNCKSQNRRTLVKFK